MSRRWIPCISPRLQAAIHAGDLHEAGIQEDDIIIQLGDLAINHIVPTAIRYMTSLVENVRGLKEIFSDLEYERLAGARKEMIITISDHISNIKKLVNEMIEERKKANIIEDSFKKALTYEKKVKPYLEQIRYHIDKLELIVDNEIWPLPKYRELLFTR